MKEDVYPLSPVQLGILYETLSAPQAHGYTLQLWADFRATLDSESFRQAWNLVFNRHPILRSSFHWAGRPQPEQVVHQRVELPYFEQDLRHLSEADQHAFLQDWIGRDFEQGVDLERAPLFRLTLFRLGAQRYRLVRTSHHLITDGYSSAIVYQQAIAAYHALRRGETPALPPARPYRAYVDWLNSQDWSAAKPYWQGRLSGFAPPTPFWVDRLPGAGSRPAAPGYDTLLLQFSAEETRFLHQAVQRHQITLNTLLQAAWALLLSRYSGESRVVFGAVRNCRKSAVGGAENILGPVINILPVALQVSPADAVDRYLQDVRRQWLDLRPFENTPLDRIYAWCGFTPGKLLFESLLNFQYQSFSHYLRSLSNDDLQWEQVWAFQGAGFPLNIGAFDENPFWLELTYDRTRFEADVIERLLGHLKNLCLSLATAAPDQRLSDLPMLAEAERHQLIYGWNDTRQDFPAVGCVHHLFEAQVERTPEAVAVIGEGQSLTYRELEERANQLAHALQKQGVGPDVLTAVCMERSPETVVAVLAALKAGGAYLPIDPTYPAERLQFMLQDSLAPVTLTQQRLRDRLPLPQGQVICVDADWDRIAQEPRTPPNSNVGPEHLAYVIYTSGSTGQPKGAMIPHRALVNHMLWMMQTFPFSAADRVIQRTPFSFDASVWEFFGPLMCGAALVVPRPGIHREIGELIETIQREKVTVIQTAPAVLTLLANHPGFGECASLRHIFCGGEALPPDLPVLVQQKLPVQVHNLYGPSEACIDSTYFTWPFGQRLPAAPIGRPIANARIYILDANLQPVPIGVPGELYVAGAGVGRGYWRRPELTAERFLPDPFYPGEMMYRSGDLARYWPDGLLEFLGRVDFQVKIRGLRVELEEIEAVLSSHPAVQQAVVRVWEDVVRQDQLLAAYIVLRAGQSVTEAELEAHAARQLPDYMLPRVYQFLEALPLSPSGKVDRKALPPPMWDDRSAASFEPPQGPLEQVLAEMWAELLGLERVGRGENFFALGGHSLLAMRLAAYVAEVFQSDLPLHLILENPTIAALARAMQQRAAGGEQLERRARAILQVAALTDEQVQAQLRPDNSQGEAL